MTSKNIDQADFEDTGYCYTLSLISGKYKTVILYCLMGYQPVRFNEMRRYIPKISDRTLSQCLKELEADGLIERRMYPQVPPKVEYSLTDRGTSLVSVLDKLCDWGTEHRPDNIAVAHDADPERSRNPFRQEASVSRSGSVPPPASVSRSAGRTFCSAYRSTVWRRNRKGLQNKILIS